MNIGPDSPISELDEVQVLKLENLHTVDIKIRMQDADPFVSFIKTLSKLTSLRNFYLHAIYPDRAISYFCSGLSSLKNIDVLSMKFNCEDQQD